MQRQGFTLRWPRIPYRWPPSALLDLCVSRRTEKHQELLRFTIRPPLQAEFAVQWEPRQHSSHLISERRRSWCWHARRFTLNTRGYCFTHKTRLYLAHLSDVCRHCAWRSTRPETRALKNHDGGILYCGTRPDKPFYFIDSQTTGHTQSERSE